MEMTIEKLESYKGLTAEIKGLREQIDSFYDTYRSPQLSDGGSHSMNVGNPVETSVMRIIELKEKLKEAEGRLYEVENFLSTIEDKDAEIRAIIRYHYILGKSWSQTNTAICGYPSYYACRKKIMRYFGKES